MLCSVDFTPYMLCLSVDNVDNFVDMWVKFDILGRKLVKKGDKFQDIGVNEQKYNVDKM